MYKDRIQNTKTNRAGARRLKQAMLHYHDFRQAQPSPSEQQALEALTLWQSQRLQHTHRDLYHCERHHTGLNFLFNELYSQRDFSARDQDLERIFPKLVKLLPDRILETVATLVELNHLTKALDLSLARRLLELNSTNQANPEINEHDYCEAYRACNNIETRQEQIRLTTEAGIKLDRYAHSSIIHFSLTLSERPADMAGLGALHGFIREGFSAFQSMAEVPTLMRALAERETRILNAILAGQSEPFELTDLQLGT